MSTKWVVTAAAERVTLDQTRTGETTFTVTNPDGVADRVVFDPVAGDGAEPDWFIVDEPQRLVRGGASVSYLMKVAIPAESPPGTYAVQGRVYSADSAPEESSVLSPRVMLEVPAPPEPTKRRWPWWWWLVAAGLVLVLLIGVGVLVFGGGGDDQTAPPTPAADPQGEEVVMPDLLGMSERDALRTLSELGLTVRPIRYRHDPERADQVVAQSIDPDSAVSAEAVVDLEVAVALTAPAVTAPTGVPVIEPDAETPTLEWDAGASPARRWQVSWSREQCFFRSPVLFTGPSRAVEACRFPEADGLALADTTSFTPELSFTAPMFAYSQTGDFHTGWVRWQVAPLDDFGVPGPASEPAYFRVALP
jgi:hypothetical protein